MKKFLLGMVSSFVLIGLIYGGIYVYDYSNRPLEAVLYGSAEELKTELERLEEIKENGSLTWREKYRLGVSYHQSLKYNDAVRVLEDFLKDKPKVGKAYETLGMSYFRLNKLEEAVERWKISISLNSGSASGNASLEMMIADVEQTVILRKRIKQLEKSLKNDVVEQDKPAQYAKQFELALLYLGDKKTAKAIEHLEELAGQKSVNVDIHATLAHAYALNGELSRAYASMERAIKLSPDNEELKQRLKEIGKLKKAIKSGEFHKQGVIDN